MLNGPAPVTTGCTRRARKPRPNPIASIFAWTRGLYYRGRLDASPEVVKFAETPEGLCVETVESGFMTKDLAILIGPGQKLRTTNRFLDKIDENLRAAMG